MAFIKRGDLQPISIITPSDVDAKSTKKALDKTIKLVQSVDKNDKKEEDGVIDQK